MLSKLKIQIRFGTALFLVATLMLPAVASALSPNDVGTWSSSTALPQALEDASSITSNGYVYVFGGDAGSSLSTVYSAPLNSNGGVGSWSLSSNNLAQATSDSTAVTYNGYAYIIGGKINNASLLSSVYSAPLGSNGAVGSWTAQSNSLPQPVTNATAVVNNGFVYVMGGSNNGTTGYINTVYYAQLGNNGTIGSWNTASNNLPQVLYKPNSLVFDGYLYVIGGTTTGGFSSTVYSSPINSNGSIGSWSASANALPQGLTNASSVVHNDNVYIIGGNDNNTYQSNVYYATLGANGVIGNWNTSANSLSQGLKGAVAASYNGYVDVIGGQNNSLTYLNTSYYSQINSVSTATINNAVNAGAITITTPSTTNVTCANAVTESSLAKQDTSYSYPLGLVNLCFTTDLINNPVSLTFVTNLTPSQVIARDFNSLTNSYTSVSGAVITETTYNGQPALQLSYTITDGGSLDSSAVPGSISDPVGLAQVIASSSVASPTSSTSAPDTGYGQPANRSSQYTVYALAGASIFSIGIGLILKRNRNFKIQAQ